MYRDLGVLFYILVIWEFYSIFWCPMDCFRSYRGALRNAHRLTTTKSPPLVGTITKVKIPAFLTFPTKIKIPAFSK